MKNWKMNPHTYHSGYVPVMVPNPTGRQLPPRPPQTSRTLPTDSQNVGGVRKQWRLDADIKPMRRYVLDKTIDFLRHQPSVDFQQVINLGRNIEAILFRGAHSKEEYVDRTTLVSRVQFLLNRSSSIPSCQQLSPYMASGSGLNNFQPVPEPTSIDTLSDMHLKHSMDSFPAAGTSNNEFTFTGSNPTFTGSSSTFTGSNPTFTGSSSTFTGSNPTFTGSNPTFTGSNPNLANGFLGFNQFENFCKPQPPNYIENFFKPQPPNFMENFCKPQPSNFMENFCKPQSSNFMENFCKPQSSNFMENFCKPQPSNFMENFCKPQPSNFMENFCKPQPSNFMENFCKPQPPNFMENFYNPQPPNFIDHSFCKPQPSSFIDNLCKPQPPNFNQQQKQLLMRSYYANSSSVSSPGNFNSVTMAPLSVSLPEVSSVLPQASSGNSSFESLQVNLLKEVMNNLKHGNMNLIPQAPMDFLHCTDAKKYWICVSGCREVSCGLPNCEAARSLWRYHQMCRNIYCTLCSSSGPRIILHEATDLHPKPSAEASSPFAGTKRVSVVPDSEILEDIQHPSKRGKMDHASTSTVLLEPEISIPEFSFQRQFLGNTEIGLPFNLNDPIINTGSFDSTQGNLDESSEKTKDSMDHAARKLEPDVKNKKPICEPLVNRETQLPDIAPVVNPVKDEPDQNNSKVNQETQVAEAENKRLVRVKEEPDQDSKKFNHEIRMPFELSKFHYENYTEKKFPSLSRKRLRCKVSYRSLPEAAIRKYKISEETRCSKRMKIYHPSNLPKEKSSVNCKNSTVKSGSSQGIDEKSKVEIKENEVQALVDQPVIDQVKTEVIQEEQVPVEVAKVDQSSTTLESPKLETESLENPPKVPLISPESGVISVRGSCSDESSEKKNCNSPAAKSSEVEDEKKQVMIMLSQETVVPMSTDVGLATKPAKPKIKGVSLTEMFTVEQIKEHITNLRQRAGLRKVKLENSAEREHPVNENSCQLCRADQLYFEPLPIYCSSCGTRIKRKSTYHAAINGDSSHYFCCSCLTDGRYERVKVNGLPISKSKLEKKRNDDEIEEEWVQCDKCEAWQHQICALFNGKRNDMGQAEYTCPYCYMGEIERGERKPLPQTAVLGAKDLPSTKLSDHLEQRLFKKLEQERQERARVLGKNFDEVEGAESLVIRVVSSSEKKVEVKKRFLDIFSDENYPAEFPYKSKAILLFQKIEGVDVCLFGVFVQEFGSGCPSPNNRRIYLSYLDSVKYFRPDIRTISGEALRTLVYHEILIGYLEYCKERGFTSCYIWACPPLKGDDYILYCHPKDQKTPKSDKLREWYSGMLQKAVDEKIILELTNLYDQFFVCTDERKMKITAAGLPYFDGDYWPGYAEDIISQIHRTEDEERRMSGKYMKLTKKTSPEYGFKDGTSSNSLNDALLMEKIGESIFPIKDDFMMVHMRHSCSSCCEFILSGILWTCNSCRNFHLCEKCYEAAQQLDEADKHPISSTEKHDFVSVEVENIHSRVEDKGDLFESEFFDTRQTFLSLCQGNHYQFDSLRRAKHSSMMILYHLHNPNAPAFISTCNVCHHDIGAGKGWRCETCSDYDICNTCYKNGEVKHDHKLRAHPLLADDDTQNKVALQRRVALIREMLDLLLHASKCATPTKCQYRYCMKLKHLFNHRSKCTVLHSGGCVLCKKIWALIRMHAQVCKESDCDFPRCTDVKIHLAKLREEAEFQRRATVMEKMRNRAAELGDHSS